MKKAFLKWDSRSPLEKAKTAASNASTTRWKKPQEVVGKGHGGGYGYVPPPPPSSSTPSRTVIPILPNEVAHQMQLAGGIRMISPMFFNNTHLTHLYANDNYLTSIPPEIGQLCNLVALDVSGNDLDSLPPELGDLVKLKELHLNDNYIEELPCEMGRLFNLQFLNIMNNPLQKEILQLQRGVNGTSKLITLLMDTMPFPNSCPTKPGNGPKDKWTSADLRNLIIRQLHQKEASIEEGPTYHGLLHPGPPPNLGSPSNLAPPTRSWLTKEFNQPDTSASQPTLIFTVFSYNVLFDKYATREKYAYCPTWALDWTYRGKMILAELKLYSADIITLQEVGTDQFYKFFLPELQQDGYAGIFAAKSRARTMNKQEKRSVDGCAIFYRVKKFVCIEEHIIEFNQIAKANAKASYPMTNRVMTKDNIGLAALLEPRQEAWKNGIPSPATPPLLVCTTHLHWNPKHCDVKVVQTMMLMNELKRITKKLLFKQIHLVLCGDFNSLPDSGVVELLKTSRIPVKHPDFLDMNYKQPLMRLSYHKERSYEYTHGFKLRSAYNSEAMPYTNYTYDFTGIIDYMFYSKSNMTLLGILGPIDPLWLKEHKIHCVPHPVIPSDHLPVMMELEITSVTSKGRHTGKHRN